MSDLVLSSEGEVEIVAETSEPAEALEREAVPSVAGTPIPFDVKPLNAVMQQMTFIGKPLDETEQPRKTLRDTPDVQVLRVIGTKFMKLFNGRDLLEVNAVDENGQRVDFPISVEGTGYILANNFLAAARMTGEDVGRPVDVRVKVTKTQKTTKNGAPFTKLKFEAV